MAEIWSGQRQGVLWSKIGPYKVFAADLQNLAPGKEVESEVNTVCCLKPFHLHASIYLMGNVTTQFPLKVLNAFIHAAIAKLEPTKGKIFHVDSFQMTAMWQGSYRGLTKVSISKSVHVS